VTPSASDDGIRGLPGRSAAPQPPAPRVLRVAQALDIELSQAISNQRSSNARRSVISRSAATASFCEGGCAPTAAKAPKRPSRNLAVGMAAAQHSLPTERG